MSNITYRLVKGQELTFAEIDENFSSLDSDIRGNRRYFDSTLEQFGLGRDSDFLAILAQRDSDAAAIILLGLANHDSDITDLNDRCDSEHAWNVVEHNDLQANINSLSSSFTSSLDSEHAWNVAEHAALSGRIDTEEQARLLADGNLSTAMDSEHAWNVAEHNTLQNNIAAEVLSAGTGISINSSSKVISNSMPDQVVSIAPSGIATVTGTYPNFIVGVANPNTDTTYTAGFGLSMNGTEFLNDMPDQIVAITGTGATSVTGTYPSFTVTSTDTTYTAGTGLSLSGTQFTNTAPDRTVSMTGSGATSVSGTYPNFTISSTDNNTTYTAGTGLSLSGTQFTNTAPDRTVSITGGGSTTVTGTYPNFSVTSVGTTYTGGNGISVSGSSIAMSGSYTGTFTATGDVVALSDMAVKSDVTAIDEALDKLMAITGYTYNTKESTRRHSGVMAQDVEKVLPEVVHTSEDGTKGVAYGNMMGLVIEAIRELKTQVDELKGK